jgi:heat-inducible transcriptional repressor
VYLFSNEFPTAGLNERDWAVLAAIIERHILTAEPVSSNQLVAHFPLGCSPATVRNSMARLEEAGFLSHPYTSAGKSPTVKAYRIFVEKLLPAPGTETPAMQRLRSELQQRVADVDHLMKLTATVLAAVSNLLAVSWVADSPAERLVRVELARLSERKLLLMAHTSYQHEIHQVFEFHEAVSTEVLERAVDLVNEHGRGLGPEELASLALADWPGMDQRLASLVRQALTVIGSQLQGLGSDGVVVEGAANLIAQPEFKDIDLIRHLMGLLDHRRELVHSLEAPGIERNGLRAIIGEENEKGLPPLSYLTVGLHLEGGREARLGVIGPVRMEYRRVIPLLVQTADTLTSLLRPTLGAKPGGR